MACDQLQSDPPPLSMSPSLSCRPTAAAPTAPRHASHWVRPCLCSSRQWTPAPSPPCAPSHFSSPARSTWHEKLPSPHSLLSLLLMFSSAPKLLGAAQPHPDDVSSAPAAGVRCSAPDFTNPPPLPSPFGERPTLHKIPSIDKLLTLSCSLGDAGAGRGHRGSPERLTIVETPSRHPPSPPPRRPTVMVSSRLPDHDWRFPFSFLKCTRWRHCIRSLVLPRTWM
jgi:hypothetical protein